MIALLLIAALTVAFALGWIARIHYEGRPRAFELMISPDKMQPTKTRPSDAWPYREYRPYRDRRPW